MLRRGEADAMLCGLNGRFDAHLAHVRNVIGVKPGAPTMAAMNALMLERHTLFIADTFVNEEPSAEELADIALMAAAEVRRFGMPPKVAFLSHSIFGSSSRPAARRMRAARDLFVQRAPGIECDGEMHGDAALSEDVRRDYLPETTLTGERQPAGAAQPGRRQHPVQRAQDDRRPRRHGGPDPAGRGEAGAHPHRVGDGAPRGQHDGAGGGGRGGSCLGDGEPRHRAAQRCCPEPISRARNFSSRLRKSACSRDSYQPWPAPGYITDSSLTPARCAASTKAV